MRWPKHPAESVRPSRFHPPFCPWPECSAHRGPSAGFQRWGSYRKPKDPARIPRFRCRACERTCSRQTFSSSYYLKRRELLVSVAGGLAACSAHRQIARSFHCSKTTVTRMAERLGRHAILFHARCLERIQAVAEPVVHDHFETFIGRQDHALGVGTAVGATSWFVYDVDPAPHRGSGRRPDRGPDTPRKAQRPYVASIRRTIQALLPKVPAPVRLQLVVDGRIDYPAAVQPRAIKQRVRLRVYPNPKRGPKGSPRTAEAVARDGAMFPVDQLHQLTRHTCSDHKRETISFGRRLESVLGRAHLMAVWKNFIKSRSERKPDRTTPAMRLGLTDSRWRWERVVSRRLFPTRERTTESARKLYWKRWTPQLPELQRRHAA
jgi:transposase-like protein